VASFSHQDMNISNDGMAPAKIGIRSFDIICCTLWGICFHIKSKFSLAEHHSVTYISTLAFWFPRVSPQWQPAETSENQETWKLGNLCPISWKPLNMVNVRATAVRRDAERNAVLAGDPKGIRLLCNTTPSGKWVTS